MAQLLIIIIVLLLLIGAGLVVLYLRHKSFGVLSQKHHYTDSKALPGDILYSSKLMLSGRPDYIVKKNDEYIPVEVKTGKTPKKPYQNHIVQLMAYCALVEEHYGVRPSHGVLKYPDAEFMIEYTRHQTELLYELIQEVIQMKQAGYEPQCLHPEHNREHK